MCALPEHAPLIYLNGPSRDSPVRTSFAPPLSAVTRDCRRMLAGAPSGPMVSRTFSCPRRDSRRPLKPKGPGREARIALSPRRERNAGMVVAGQDGRPGGARDDHLAVTRRESYTCNINKQQQHCIYYMYILPHMDIITIYRSREVYITCIHIFPHIDTTCIYMCPHIG